jgi:tripartite-type tricarboxylate transporter receptor subunit TctC
MGGHIPVGLTALAAIAGQVQAGSVRGLAIATEKRLPAYPDLPTYEEQGYPGLVASAWFALAAPAGLPPDIVVRVNAEVVKALQAPDLQARFAREAIDTKTLDADAFTAFFKAEQERWTPLAKKVAEEMKRQAR